jgi:hypothetical protein
VQLLEGKTVREHQQIMEEVIDIMIMDRVEQLPTASGTTHSRLPETSRRNISRQAALASTDESSAHCS